MMSFGVGVSDCVKLLELANEARTRFVDAPEQFKAISKEVAGLSNVLRDIECVLLQQELTDWQEKALLPVLEECHNVLVALGKLVDENYCLKTPYSGGLQDKSRRLWKKLTWEPNDIQGFRSRIALNIGLLNAFNGSVTSKLTLATKHSIDRLHERKDNRERYDEHQAILDWLTPTDYAPQQSDYISRRQEGTGQWLLISQEFISWLNQSKQTLFCPGIPGAGKTILASFVIDFLHSRFQGDPTVGIAYLYCNFRLQHEQRPIDLLLCILKQLVQKQLSKSGTLQRLYYCYKEKPSRPSLDEILKSLQSVVADYSRTFIIIDALDECQISNGGRTKLLSEIFNLQAKTGSSLFATSRFIPEIIKEFEGSVSLEIRASGEDVRRYLDGHMKQLPSFVLRNLDLQEEIKTKIIEAVDGMFLLTQLHINSLIGKKSVKAIKTALKKLPQGSDAYDHAYKEAMERIEGQITDSQELAKQVLAWITCAKRPLTVLEIRHALAVELGESALDEENLPEIEDMVSVCAGLVTVDEGSSIIRLVHYTTQEYFERTQRDWFPDAQRDIAKTCVTYLSFDAFESGFCLTDEEFETRLQLNPLCDYAAQNWGHHARAAIIEEERFNFDFLKIEAHLSASSQVMMVSKFYLEDSGYSQRFPKQMKGVHLAAYFGLREELIALVEEGYDINLKDSCDRTPLSWAARNGYEAIVKLLQEKGAELEPKDSYGSTPLLLATRYGYEAIVKLLLKEGAELNFKDNYGYTPLLLAARNGHEATVKLLLENGAKLESKDNYGSTPISWAAQNGHETIVKLLLENGAELDFKDNYGYTPLLLAARDRQDAVVKLLLGKGAKLESKDHSGCTPLSWAALNGHETVVILLLEKGAELEPKDDSSYTPLLWAAQLGHKAVVNLLLEKGAELECKDDSGWTPLLWAVQFGHKAVVKLLLEKGADLAAKDNFGCTPLSWAARNGHEAIVKLLLEKGANLELKDSSGRTPLLRTVKYGQEAVVKLLLEKGAELELKDNSGHTPLIRALQYGQEAVVKLLLEKGAELEPKDNSGYIPLSWAVQFGHEAVVKLLLEKGAELEYKDNFGCTPLLRAVQYGQEAVVKLLLDNGAELDSKDSFGRTPLLWAARDGQDAVVRLLLTKNSVNPEIKDNFNSTSLSIASRCGQEEVVRLLLMKDSVDLESKDNLGRTAISFAAKNGYTNIVKLLLQKYEVNGISIPADALVILKSPVTFDKSQRYCDVCLLNIPDGNIYHHCDICSDGDFDACQDCVTVGAHCLDHSHKLDERMDEGCYDFVGAVMDQFIDSSVSSHKKDDEELEASSWYGPSQITWLKSDNLV